MIIMEYHDNNWTGYRFVVRRSKLVPVLLALMTSLLIPAPYLYRFHESRAHWESGSILLPSTDI